MPGMDGLETLARIKEEHPLLEVIMLTGHATVESAIEGMKNGAFDYLMKPCDPTYCWRSSMKRPTRNESTKRRSWKRGRPSSHFGGETESNKYGP